MRNRIRHGWESEIIRPALLERQRQILKDYPVDIGLLARKLEEMQGMSNQSKLLAWLSNDCDVKVLSGTGRRVTNAVGLLDLPLVPGQFKNGSWHVSLIARAENDFWRFRYLFPQFAADLVRTVQLNEGNIKETCADLTGLFTSYGSIIGTSKEMKKLYSEIELAARSHLNVLLVGETGSGKELTAREIHNKSTRASRPFETVHPGDMRGDPNWAYIRLFGAAPGYAQWASDGHEGQFEKADRGTILLDEIHTYPESIWPMLLRATREKQIMRLGGNTFTEVDVRIIAATSVDLNDYVKKGRFPKDLWYRIKGLPILVPPLRKRTEDIPLLTDHFVRRCASERSRKEIFTFGDKAMQLLRDHFWDGNVAELEHIVERAFDLNEGSTEIDEIAVKRAIGMDGVVSGTFDQNEDAVILSDVARNVYNGIISKKLVLSPKDLAKIYGNIVAAGVMWLWRHNKGRLPNNGDAKEYFATKSGNNILHLMQAWVDTHDVKTVCDEASSCLHFMERLLNSKAKNQNKGAAYAAP